LRRLQVTLVGVALVWALLWFVLLAAHPLFNPDEGRYAEIPREMLATGDFLVPRLNGLIYIEKPPLQYWATLAGFAVFGISEWAARLCVGVGGVLTVLIVFALADRLWGRRVAWRAGLMCGSTFLLVLMSHHLTLDMSLTLFVTAALAAFCMAQEERVNVPRRHLWMTLAWIATALGVLTKGLVAMLLPAVTVFIYSILQKDYRVWKSLSPTRGVPWFILIAAPWFLWMQHAVPQFFDFFFVREHLQRYLTRMADRHEPWWFFIPVLLVGVLPWVASAARAFATGWRPRVPRGEFDVRRFLWVWVVVTFVFFSASDAKLVPYILPLFPALVLLMAAGEDDDLRRELAVTARGLGVFGLALALFAAVEPALVRSFGWNEMILQLRPWLLAIAIALLAGGVASARAKQELTGSLAIIGVAAFAGAGLLLWSARVLTPLFSGEPLARGLPPELNSVPVYAIRHYDQTLPFYLGRTTTLVEERNEMDFGLRLEPWRGIDRLSDFEPRWRDSTQALAVLEEQDMEELQRRGWPLRIRSRTAREVLVSRR
jgi:4-amino-4-deoxy-L-arabinose transferase-like glycosyltransferase